MDKIEEADASVQEGNEPNRPGNADAYLYPMSRSQHTVIESGDTVIESGGFVRCRYDRSRVQGSACRAAERGDYDSCGPSGFGCEGYNFPATL